MAIRPISRALAGLRQSMEVSPSAPRANVPMLEATPAFFRPLAATAMRTTPMAAITSSHPMMPLRLLEVRNLDQKVPAPVHFIT